MRCFRSRNHSTWLETSTIRGKVPYCSESVVDRLYLHSYSSAPRLLPQTNSSSPYYSFVLNSMSARHTLYTLPIFYHQGKHPLVTFTNTSTHRLDESPLVTPPEAATAPNNPKILARPLIPRPYSKRSHKAKSVTAISISRKDRGGI